MKFKSKIKDSKGSITLYVLISMFFFLFVLIGIYTNTIAKIEKQNKDLDKVINNYKQENIDDLYKKLL